MEERNKQTLEEFLNDLSISIAREFIRKTKENEEKPSNCIYLFGRGLEDLLYISGKMYELLVMEGYSDIVVNYGEKRIDGAKSKVYQLDIKEFIKLNERAKEREKEIVLT